MTQRRLVYLDQNAWIALARGAWDKATYPSQHAALTCVIAAVQDGRIVCPLSFTNIYETAKINDPVRRAHLARVQCAISGGRVFRGRRRVLKQALTTFLADQFVLETTALPSDWFLSDLWFEAAADYSPEIYGFEISDAVLDYFRRDPARSLFSYLTEADDETRVEGVRRYSAASADLLARLEARRTLVAGEPFPLRKRVYAARLLIDECEFILSMGRRLGLPWGDVKDIGGAVLKRLVAAVPVLNAERELAVRLEDQARAPTENDLRDMSAFTTILPLVDVLVAEKPFVNMSRQANLGEQYATQLMTNISELAEALQPSSFSVSDA